MEEKIDEFRLDGCFTPVGIYRGEEDTFGKEGWFITYKLFEWASRGELIRLNPNIQKGRLFHEGKLVHCFLNCWGYSISDEFRFHLKSSLERMLVSRGILTPSTEEVKNMIKELEETVPKVIFDIIDKHHISDE